MATYKKRGYKPKKVKENNEEISIEEMESTTAEVFNTLDESASRTEEWVAKNQKYIFILVGAVAAIVLGYLAYNQFVQEPKEADAANESFQAQLYVEQAMAATGATRDSLYTLALEGGEGKYGLLEIASKYSGTKAANLANYSAGMAYLNLNKYEEAVSHLQDFSSDDVIYNALAKGAIGDAFVQLNQLDEALNYYEKAANANANEFTAPKFLFKAGNTAMELGQKDKAIVHYKKIKEEFPNSEEARTIDIFIGKAEAMQ